MKETLTLFLSNLQIPTHLLCSCPPCSPIRPGAQSDRSVNLSCHLHTQSRLITHGALPLFLYRYSWPAGYRGRFNCPQKWSCNVSSGSASFIGLQLIGREFSCLQHDQVVTRQNTCRPYRPVRFEVYTKSKIYVVMSRLCHCLLILTEEFADDLGNCLSLEKPTLPCL